MTTTTKSWSREDEERLLCLVQLGLQTGEVDEDPNCYLSSGYSDKAQGCFIGTALVGRFGGAKIALEQYKQGRMSPRSYDGDGTYISMFSKMLGVNLSLLQRISCKHYNGQTISHIMEQLREGVFV